MTQTATPQDQLRVNRDGTLLVPAGYPGASLRIRQGALQVDCGFGRELRVSRSARPRLRRLVVIGRAGWWSFEVPAWLAGVGASWVHLSRDGELLGAGPDSGGPDHPRLRAAQAMAHATPIGFAISQGLVCDKLAAQRALLERRFPGETTAIRRIEQLEAAVMIADGYEELRAVEAEAAGAYFAGWVPSVHVRVAHRDQALVPDHWQHFSGRVSHLSERSYRASDPLNTIMNLLGAALLIETRIAMISVGLDPGIPVGLHAFQRGRPSGALDILEPARPAYEEIALRLTDATTFTRRDFHERRDGSIAIGADLLRRLLDAMPLLAEAVAPIVEQVAQQLADSADLGTLATPLTEANRRQSRATTRKRSRHSPASPPRALRRCIECGTELAAGQRELCAACQAVANQDRLDTYRDTQIARRREADQPPTASPAVRERIGDSQRAHWDARRQADPTGGFTAHPSEFRRLIQPKLAGQRPSDLARATGLSPGYCAQVRDGQRVPHVRHWAAFQLAGLAQ